LFLFIYGDKLLMNLLLLIFTPLASALFVLAMRTQQQIKLVALVGASVQLVLSFLLFFKYKSETPKPILFEQQYNWFAYWNISFHIGVDGIAVAMILLTSFVVIAGVLMSWHVGKMQKEFFFLLILLSVGAYGFFISLDLFVLFFFLEIAVIPKYLLIGIWGSGKKEYSANKLALLLMFGSALILVGILGVYFGGGKTFDILQLATLQIPVAAQKICFILLFVGFGVFTALFPFHTWVPDGHSSAPTAGSMFLAGISMKLGGYGALRIATFLLPEGAKEYANVIIILSVIGILYGSFATLMQKDLKYMNAYSSVSHCGFVLLGIGMLTKVALAGAVMQMISHGLMTALFFAVIGMIYERTHTRQIDEMGGLLKTMPFIITILFITGLCSLGLPGLSGFVAEMTIFVGSWQNADAFHRIATVAACISILVTAVYILRAIGSVAMGPLKENYIHLTDAKWNEKLAAVILLIGIIALGVIPFWLQDLINPSVNNIIEKIAPTATGIR
jgi:NADH-quinone oxidoreductase subunit M